MVVPAITKQLEMIEGALQYNTDKGTEKSRKTIQSCSSMLGDVELNRIEGWDQIAKPELKLWFRL